MYVADSFTEENIKTMALYGHQQQQPQQQWSPDVTRRHHCTRRCDIAMVIVIFTGRLP